MYITVRPAGAVSPGIDKVRIDKVLTWNRDCKDPSFFPEAQAYIWGQKRTTKKRCDKGFAECSGKLSGAIRIKILVYWVMTRESPRIVQKVLWCCSCNFRLCESFLAPDTCDSNRGTTNAGSVRTNFCVFKGDIPANKR